MFFDFIVKLLRSEKYFRVAVRTLGANSNDEIMVGMDIKAKAPSIRLIIAANEDIDPMTMVAT